MTSRKVTRKPGERDEDGCRREGDRHGVQLVAWPNTRRSQGGAVEPTGKASSAQVGTAETGGAGSPQPGAMAMSDDGEDPDAVGEPAGDVGARAAAKR